MDKIVTTRGEPSKQAEKYMYQLAAERITGRPTTTYKSWQMQEGNEREAESRLYYEMATGHAVEQVTFVYGDESKQWGCSPDGLIDETGGYETKNPEAHTHCERLLKCADKVPTDYVVQVQSSLLFTGRQWWQFMSYYPGLRSIIVTVEPDYKLHRAMSQLLADFCGQLDEVTKRIAG